MILLSAHKLEKSFASRTLFRGLTFAIEEQNRIGLIGPNGAGKSTMLKILAGQMARDGGELSAGRGVRIALLDQTPKFQPEHTIYDAVAAALDDPYDGEELARLDQWLSRLELNQGEMSADRPMDSLSGGWKKRVALARELVKNPDLLLLDEPTNHLDVEGIEWLEEFLQEARFATITITHDRLFLQRIANRIFDLDPRYQDGLLVVNGDYLTYLETRDELIRSQEQREVVLRNTLRRETEWLRRGAKARTTKQKARIDRAGDLGSEVEDLGARNMSRRLRIDFQESERNPQKLIQAEGISKAYGDKGLFKDLDLILSPQTRLGLLGKNGSGKSTLIRCLLGLEEIDSGKIKRAEKLDVAYFEQHRDTIDVEKTLLRNICPEGDYVEFRGQFIFARSYLDRFLFRTEQHDMPVSKLSGGEQARLRVAQMMLQTANILVLDEPTNDLDLATMAVLEEVLSDFKGAVILVTHDRYFLDQVSNRLLAFDRDVEGEPLVQEFAEFSQWETWWQEHRKELKRATRSGRQAAAGVSSSQAKKKKMTFKDKHELEKMEALIHSEESELSRLQSEAGSPGSSANAQKLTEIYQKISQLQERIARLYSRWDELEKMAQD